MPPLLMPQPPIAPLIPPTYVVDLMTTEGSVAFGARWKGQEAKIMLITHKPQRISGTDMAWGWYARRPM